MAGNERARGVSLTTHPSEERAGEGVEEASSA